MGGEKEGERGERVMISRLGSNKTQRQRCATRSLRGAAQPSPTVPLGRELREDASKKGAQSRAANEQDEHGAPPHSAAPSRRVVSLSRSTAAESRGRRWTSKNNEGAADLDGGGGGSGIADRYQKEERDERKEEGKRKRLRWSEREPVSSVSYVVSVESVGNREPRVSRHHRGPHEAAEGGGGRREGARAEPHALFRARNQYARRARSVRCCVRVLEVYCWPRVSNFCV